MIEQNVFLQQMALLADRIGKPLAGPTQREYHRILSAALTTEQFLAAATIAFATWSAEYRTWPSPQQLIELVAPVAEPTLSAFEAFERVLSIMEQSHEPLSVRRSNVEALGGTAYRGFLAAGGTRDFANVLEVDVPWIRKRFVEAYEAACEGADAERTATLALSDADSRLQLMANSIAQQKSLPSAKKAAAGS